MEKQLEGKQKDYDTSSYSSKGSQAEQSRIDLTLQSGISDEEEKSNNLIAQ